MFTLQIKKLREQLATEGLGAKHAFQYYLATAILGALTYELVANGPGSGGEMLPVDYLDGGLDFVFTIGGIIWCYVQNGGAAGRDFLSRIVPIGWVMFWRTLLFGMVPFTILIGFLNWYNTGNYGRPESETIIEIIIHNAIWLGMYWRMGVHMKWIGNDS